MTKDSEPTSDDLALGSLINERYRVVSVIGRGGLSTVYRAEDESLGRSVALKVLSGSLSAADDARRHQDEVRLIAGFDHPALVTLYDFVPVDDGPAAMLVMQFIDGTNLASRIARGPLSSELTAEIGVDVAAALAHVHASGVIHRDVKPANILLPETEGGPVARLADFGIARLVDEAGITATGTIVGTASYLSPEQAAGGSLGPETDIYSLGLVLLECLTGVRAFPGGAAESVAARLSADPTIPEHLDPAWRSLLSTMCAREPAARPDALEVERTLREISGPGGDAPTRVLPAADAATTELLAPAVAATPTERLVPAASAASAAPAAARHPFPVARALIVAGVALVALLLTAVLLQWRPPAAATPAPTTSTSEPSASADAIVYPAVAGDLGDALTQLQHSVSSLGSTSATENLQARVLAITQFAADEDYESALAAVDSLRETLDDTELTATEREDIQRASDQVRARLEKLIKDANGPGNSDKPGKKP